MRIPGIPVTREHGSWAVLIVPMFIGASIAGRYTLQFWLLFVSALGVFMSYVPVHTLLRHLFLRQPSARLQQAVFWVSVYLGISVLCATPLLLQGLWMVLAFGGGALLFLVANFLLMRQRPKSIPGDLCAVAGLTLGAPCGYYVVTGSADMTALLLWVLNFMFFGCSVVYVHMKVHASATKKVKLALKEKLTIGRLNLLYHVAVMTIVAILSVTHFTAQFAILAFVPMAVHAVYGTWKLSGRVRFKTLGMVLLGQSVVFAVLLGFVYG